MARLRRRPASQARWLVLAEGPEVGMGSGPGDIVEFALHDEKRGYRYEILLTGEELRRLYEFHEESHRRRQAADARRSRL